jgi:hypothetical protein
MSTNTDTKSAPLFETGKFHATPNALRFLGALKQSVVPYFDHHTRGDWSEMDHEDQKANQDAIQSGHRIFSSFKAGDGTIWIITEADRSTTTVLLPSDY